MQTCTCRRCKTKAGGALPEQGGRWGLLTWAAGQGKRPKLSRRGRYEPADILKRNFTVSKMNSGRGQAAAGRSHGGTEQSGSGVLKAEPQDLRMW